MDNFPGDVFIITACMVVLLIGAVKGQMEWMLNIVTRSIWGTIAMLFVNHFLASVGISLGVGVNALTVLTTGILGFPGFLALYGIGIYQLL